MAELKRRRSRSAGASRRQGDPWPRTRTGFVSWWQDHLRIARETMHFVSARLGTSLLVWLLVGIALALPAGLLLLQLNLADMTSAWDGRPGLSVYFDLDVDGETVKAVAAGLREREETEDVRVTSSEEALAEFQSYTSLADALDLLQVNPLPASLRATLVSGSSLADLELIAGMAAEVSGVSEVVVEKTWLERVIDITRIVSRLGMILGALFGVGAVLVTATSVRLAIEARLEELRVLKLVGATDRQIRRPFLYFGAFYGLGGGLVAAMLISLCLVAIESPLSNLLGSYGRDVETAGFDPLFLSGLLLMGGLLGVVGALLAARQRLTDLEIL
ncbi:MAG: permease-like cell division protein FtsX [Gammaproteobacteria bacterium]|nr:permease-like cell division protein FtsX [Gammaproteobacteria bacterium]